MWRGPELAVANFKRLFEDSIDELHGALEGVFAAASTRGTLRSGNTVQDGVLALERVFAATLKECFNTVDLISTEPGPLRHQLIAELESAFDQAWQGREQQLLDTLARLRFEGRMAGPLLRNSKARLRAALHDFRDR